MYPESVQQDSFLDLSSILIQQMPYLTQNNASNQNLQLHSSTQQQEDKVDIQKQSTKSRRIKRNLKIKNKRNSSKPKKTKCVKRKSKKRRGAEMGPDYRKNICGYVVKKIIRELVGQSYCKKVIEICKVEGVNYNELVYFYSSKIEGITGPSHIPPLLTPVSGDQFLVMRAFLVFFKWFLEERYVRHLLNEGKMQIKRAYIQYKNKELMPLVLQFEKKLQAYSDSSTTIQGIHEENSSL